MRHTRRGLTIIELLTVVAVLGILAGITVPKVQEIRRRADAARVVGAIEVVRHAAYSYNESRNDWPPTTAFGLVPVGLASYLPSGFGFTQPGFTVAWVTLSVVENGQLAEYHTIGVFIQSGPTCQYLHGMLGGGSNPDLTAVCWDGGGQVQLKMDR